MKKILLATFASAIIFSSCNNPSKTEVKEKTFSDPIVEHIDSSIAPGNNFFLFANNSWFKKNPIPSSENSNGIFRTIGDTINQAIKNICESAAADSKTAKGGNKQKIGDFYFSGMDTLTIGKAGITALSDELKKIDDIKNTTDLLKETTRLYTMGVGGMFGFNVGLDDKNSTKYAVHLAQCRLGLPERDYYFNPNARTTAIRNEYLKHLKKMFLLFGSDETASAKNSESVMKVETALAKASRKMEDLRDPYKNYNKMTIAQMNKLTPSLKWNELISDLGVPNADTVIVGQPEFFTALDNNLKQIGIGDWKQYLKWNLMNSSAEFLNKEIETENFNFYSTVLEGVKEQKVRWKRIVENTDGLLGELIGQVYVDEYLPKGTKEKLTEIGNNIRSVFAEHIKQLDWMSEATKQKALSKLAKINMKVGYPDKWKDMSSVEITRNNYFQNVMNVSKWRYNFMISKYGKPVDHSE